MFTVFQTKWGTEITFDKVLLVDNEGAITVGTPVVEGAKVNATVLSHLKGEKVIVLQKETPQRLQKEKRSPSILYTNSNFRNSSVTL